MENKDKVLQAIFDNDPMNILDISHDKENRLIAEFMGEPTKMWADPAPIPGNDYRITFIKDDYKEKHEDDIILIQYGGGSEAEVFRSEIYYIDLLYHSSWDWLMPVVRKINELCHDHDNIDSEELFMSDEYTSILDTISIAVIEDAYKVVIEFIQYYNTLSPVMGSFDVNGDTI